jgi:hypothetical protein
MVVYLCFSSETVHRCAMDEGCKRHAIDVAHHYSLTRNQVSHLSAYTLVVGMMTAAGKRRYMLAS